jgi:Cu-Zn family superoxide dismutase
MKLFLSLIAAGALAASANAAAFAATGKADLRGTAPDSDLSGEALFEETAEGLRVRAAVRNAPPGPHGFHIHDFGSCAGAGAAAGGHNNPGGAPHGSILADGPGKAHPGDLGNFEIGPDGTGTLEAVVPGLALAGGDRSVGGRAVIFHEKRDDFSQPAGNAGGRIGCGPILITG